VAASVPPEGTLAPVALRLRGVPERADSTSPPPFPSWELRCVVLGVLGLHCISSTPSLYPQSRFLSARVTRTSATCSTSCPCVASEGQRRYPSRGTASVAAAIPGEVGSRATLRSVWGFGLSRTFGEWCVVWEGALKTLIHLVCPSSVLIRRAPALPSQVIGRSAGASRGTPSALGVDVFVLHPCWLLALGCCVRAAAVTTCSSCLPSAGGRNAPSAPSARCRSTFNALLPRSLRAPSRDVVAKGDSLVACRLDVCGVERARPVCSAEVVLILGCPESSLLV